MFDWSPLILLIEDDPLFRRLMVAYLELWGARVIEADNGEEGLLQAELNSPDLVLSDLLLPAPSDQELITSLKRRHPALPVIAISGQQKMADVARALRAGAEDYLIKPIRSWNLVAEVIAGSLRPDPGKLLDELNEQFEHSLRPPASEAEEAADEEMNDDELETDMVSAPAAETEKRDAALTEAEQLAIIQQKLAQQAGLLEQKNTDDDGSE